MADRSRTSINAPMKQIILSLLQNLHTASAGVAKALNDSELPVRVQAAFALNAMIQSHEYGEHISQ